MQALKQSNFYWPLRLLPATKRNAIFTLYHFCHQLDSDVDNADNANGALAAITFWQGELVSIYRQRGTVHPISNALRAIIEAYNLPKPHFDAILEGMVRDAHGEMHTPTINALHEYCYSVASTVGLLSLPIFGASSDNAEQFAITLGHALQRTNILRDIREDALRSRLYLPKEWLVDTGIDKPCTESLLSDITPYLAAIEQLQAKTLLYFSYSKENYAALELDERKVLRPAMMMCAIYEALLKKMMRKDPPPISRVSLSAFEKLRAIYTAC